MITLVSSQKSLTPNISAGSVYDYIVIWNPLVNKLKFPIFERFCCQYPLINYLSVHETVRQQHEADWAGKKDAAALDGTDPAHVLPVGHAEQVHVVQGPA